MDLSTSIAQMSTAMQQTSLQQGISSSIMKKSMDVSSELAAGEVAMISKGATAFPGDAGAIFDARA